MKAFVSTTLLFLSSLLVAQAQTPSYEQALLQWRNERIQDLKSEDGWLNLAGLFWLNPGTNSFGTDASNDIIFPDGLAESQMGQFIVQNDSVFIQLKPGVDVGLPSSGDKQPLLIYPTVPMTQMAYRSLRWFIIQRGEKFAIRLRDLESPFLKEFTGIDYFPIQEKYRVKATFVAYENKQIDILDVTGRIAKQNCPGKLIFELNGKKHAIDVLDGGEEEYFLLFGDETNKKTTYGAGRFLYVPKPDKTGYTVIDFNKAYNPPCAFTPFATCPLPPKQNLLRVTVEAGELNYGNH